MVRTVTAEETWLAAVWPFVRDNVPPAPARVLEIGCGPLGGFVPRLALGGYDATGVDPEAPEAPGYARVAFEEYDAPQQVDAIVACTSLHHVGDLGEVLGKAAAMLTPPGVIVVVEWARELFDEATVRWCLERLDDEGTAPGWLHHCRDEWRESGAAWGDHCHEWAEHEALHRGEDVVQELDARFDRVRLTDGPYFFPDLAGVTEADEQAAIDAGLIRATRIEYVGRRRVG
jgi:SAM-dependent methyltransferase